MLLEQSIEYQQTNTTPQDLLRRNRGLTPQGQDLFLKCARQLRVRDHKEVVALIKQASKDGAKLLGEE